MKEVLKLASDPNFYELCELLVFSTLKFVPWDVKQTNKVTVFDISQGTSFLCGRILQNSARLYEIVSESISIHPGRNLKLVASAFEKATIYDIFAIFAVGKLSINYSLNHILRN